MDISGVWEGHYFQNRLTNEMLPSDTDASSPWAFPIRAEITTNGSTISGTMYDLNTAWETTDAELYRHASSGLSMWQRISRKLVHIAFPRLRLVSNMPSQSFINGQHSDKEIRFRKVYVGRRTDSWRTGQKEIPLESGCADVDYVGTIGAEGDTIEGTFSLYDEQEKKTITGSFRLEKRTSPPF